jgi:hypothetical protein
MAVDDGPSHAHVPLMVDEDHPAVPAHVLLDLLPGPVRGGIIAYIDPIDVVRDAHQGSDDELFLVVSRY